MLMVLGNSLMKSSIIRFAFVALPSIGTRRIFFLHPRHRIVKPKRTSRIATAFGNSHDGHATSNILLSKLNTLNLGQNSIYSYGEYKAKMMRCFELE